MDFTQIDIHPVYLRFSDVSVTIASDSREFLDNFARIYRRFLRREPCPSPDTHLDFFVGFNAGNPWGMPVIVCNQEVYPVHDIRLLDGYAYERIISAVFTTIRSHFLIHAGVVSYNNQALLVIADAYHGKTTLCWNSSDGDSGSFLTRRLLLTDLTIRCIHIPVALWYVVALLNSRVFHGIQAAPPHGLKKPSWILRKSFP